MRNGSFAGSLRSCSSTYADIAMFPSSRMAISQPMRGSHRALLVGHPDEERDEAIVRIEQRCDRPCVVGRWVSPPHSHTGCAQLAHEVTPIMESRMNPNSSRNSERAQCMCRGFQGLAPT